MGHDGREGARIDVQRHRSEYCLRNEPVSRRERAMKVWHTEVLSPQEEKINECLKYMQRCF